MHKVAGCSGQRQRVARQFAEQGGVLVARLAPDVLVDTGDAAVDAVAAYSAGADADRWIGRCVGSTHALGTADALPLYIVHDGSPLRPAWSASL